MNAKHHHYECDTKCCSNSCSHKYFVFVILIICPKAGGLFSATSFQRFQSSSSDDSGSSQSGNSLILRSFSYPLTNFSVILQTIKTRSIGRHINNVNIFLIVISHLCPDPPPVGESFKKFFYSPSIKSLVLFTARLITISGSPTIMRAHSAATTSLCLVSFVIVMLFSYHYSVVVQPGLL